MATWKIPVTWEKYGMVKVEADTLEEAMEIARDDVGVIPLPEGDYVDGSWQLAEENICWVRELYNDGQQDEEE